MYYIANAQAQSQPAWFCLNRRANGLLLHTSGLCPWRLVPEFLMLSHPGPLAPTFLGDIHVIGRVRLGTLMSRPTNRRLRGGLHSNLFNGPPRIADPEEEQRLRLLLFLPFSTSTPLSLLEYLHPLLMSPDEGLLQGKSSLSTLGSGQFGDTSICTHAHHPCNLAHLAVDLESTPRGRIKLAGLAMAMAGCSWS
ncbi:hypothetical protein BDZ91DRAFT_763072 [Kalaharituber pfeilii]|nr:hypothetical protein BDZ91DRAFT_763072 [Kalaharituber pfeilii]